MTNLGAGIVAGTAVYVALLLAIGALSRRARRESSLSDFYLAGRTIGSLVLLFTLFATQYSGNSLSGFPGQTYREGIAYYMSVTFMVAIVAGYLPFAPRLFALSRRQRFVTPTDFLDWRFGSRALDMVSAGILTLVLVNFLLAQTMAMGYAFAGLTGGRIPYWAGVAGGALVILVYELLGGMRAVAWTDLLQGLVLAVGLLLAASLVLALLGSPAEVLRQVAEVAPAKVASPSWSTCAVWLSNFLLLGLGAPLYPQAIQRIYAARSGAHLRRALAVMAFLPHVAITTVVFLGAAGIALFPDLDRAGSEQVTFRVLAWIAESEPRAAAAVILVMMAVLSAIMSTADSCLLSLSSILGKDFVARLRGLDAAQAERSTRWTPLLSAATMTVVVLLALRPLTTLWGLLVVKFETLVQLSPAFVLGALHEPGESRAFRSGEILAGLAVGIGTLAALYSLGLDSLGGFHPGTLGVALNYATVLAARALRRY